MVGKNFSKALAFYLDGFENYLKDIKKLGDKKHNLKQKGRFYNDL